ncbi:MAG TPA: 2'-5' RNA ligase family protein [Anaerolineales bacterium]|nr:2'-5' RNA ligase family protein [Anaerolineales bacterium]
MKAAIALLSDFPAQNIARRMVYEICQHAGIDFLGALLPAHVSLKQPFTFEDIDTLEEWFDSFSSRTAPRRIEFEHIYYDEWDDYAIVGMAVRETLALRALHNQINSELKGIVTDPSAPHDGEEYRFHLTIELGKVGNTNPFKQFYESLPEKHIDLSFRAETIALFFYADGPIGAGSFLCYKVLPLTGSTTPG